MRSLSLLVLVTIRSPSILAPSLTTSCDQTLTITAGTGADTISLDKVNGHTSVGAHYGSAKFVIAAGDSLTTAHDSITGFDDGGTADLSDILDFVGISCIRFHSIQ